MPSARHRDNDPADFELPALLMKYAKTTYSTVGWRVASSTAVSTSAKRVEDRKGHPTVRIRSVYVVSFFALSGPGQ